MPVTVLAWGFLFGLGNQILGGVYMHGPSRQVIKSVVKLVWVYMREGPASQARPRYRPPEISPIGGLDIFHVNDVREGWPP